MQAQSQKQQPSDRVVEIERRGEEVSSQRSTLKSRDKAFVNHRPTTRLNIGPQKMNIVRKP